MVSMTLAVSTDLKKEMDKFPDINWSAVAREAIKQKILLMKKFREFTKNSTMREEDALMLGKIVSKAVATKHKKR